MKRFLALLLAFLLVIGLMPAFALAEDSDFTETVYRAAFSDAVTVDGIAAEADWRTYGQLSDGTNFGILWDSDNIYIAAAAEALTVTADGAAAEAAESAYATVLEQRFSLADLGIALTDYSKTVALTLTSGDASWAGTLQFSSLERNIAPSWNLKGTSVNLWTAAGSATSVGSEAVAGGMRLYNKYVTPVDANDNAGGGRVYWIDSVTKPWALREGTVVLEMDILAAAMPELEVKAHTYTHVFPVYGMNFAIADGDGMGITTAVTNTPEGLYFAIYSESGSLRTAPIGKTLGEAFHLTQELAENGTLKVFVDDALIGTFTGAIREQKKMSSVAGTGLVSFNLWADADQVLTEDGAFDSDVTVTNVVFGALKGETALDALNFEAIRGANISADAVTSDLNLMTLWSNGQLANVPLTWSSSNPDVIDPATGKVAPTGTYVDVTLTATITGTQLSKEIKVTVAPQIIEAYFTDSTVTLDGVLSEQAWPGLRVFNHVTEGGPSGSVAAMWYQETAYLAVTFADAASLKLELQGCEWTVDLADGTVTGDGLTAAIGSGTAELAVDLAAAGIKLMDYNTVYQFQMTLTGDGGSASVEPGTMEMVFISRELVKEDFSGSGENYKNYVVRDENNGLTFMGEHASDPEVLYATGISAISIRKDVQLELTVDAKTMPISTGAVSNNWQADGLFLFLLDYDETVYPADPTSAANYVAMGTVLYNTANGLVLRVRQGAAVTSFTDIPLGKHAGEGSFRLGIVWRNEPYQTSFKGLADIYVDGMLLKTVEWVNYNYKGSKDSVNLRYYEDEAAAVTISDLTFTVETFNSVADEITAEAMLQGIDPTAVESDLTLPETFDSPYLGVLPLTWASSDETVLQSDGTVIRPAGKGGKYVNLTLYVGSNALWTKSLYVPGADTSPNLSSSVLGAGFTAEAPVIDGALSDHGWNMNTALQTQDGTKLGRLGIQWDESYLYLAVEHGTLTPVIAWNGETLTAVDTASANGVTELVYTLADLGITEPDYGKALSASVALGDAGWTGTVVLTSNDWFYTDSTEPRYGSPLIGSVKLGNDDPTANQGVTRLSDGFYFFDHYDENGKNPTMVRSYAILYGNTDANKALLAPLADRSVASFVEFDFLADAMPVYTLNNLKDHNEYYASSGFCWLLSDEQINNKSQNISFSILNTEDGLVLAARGTESMTLPLNKQVGEQFRIGLRWELNGDVTIFIDGEYFGEMPSVEMDRPGVGNTALAMSLIRSFDAATGMNDNFDVTITNIAIGKTYGDSLLDALTFDLFRGENEDPYSITSQLQLPETLSNPQLATPVEILWSSSDPSVLSADGKVTPADKGTLLVLTASVRGKTKEFELYIPGTSTDLNVLIAEADKDTANGAGIAKDQYLYTLDQNNNSVIFDQKTSKVFNSIVLTDSDTCSRLNESTLTIWVSDNNRTYTQIPAFKLLRSGNRIYLYDFEAQARYVKVHCAIHTAHEADFTAPLATMISVSYEEVFGDNGGTFTQTTADITNTAQHTVYDSIFTVAGEAQRVLLNGELLYHYAEDGSTYVRVPMVEAGQTVSLTLLSGNADALDISNREYVHEVVYGTREVIGRDNPRWIAAMPDGSLVGITTEKTDDGEVVMAYNFSYNMGLTWTDLTHIDCSIGYILYAGGVGVDAETGRIIAHGIGPKVVWNANDSALSDCKTWLFYSDDYGKTWTRSPEMAMDGKTATYYLSYTDPTRLATADGEDGSGVDFVLPLGVQSDKNDGSLVCRVAYSTDGGATWTMSASEISYTGGEQWHYEGGVSEATILQRQDGTLVLYGRCQFGDVDFFARSYSSDFGVTWQEAAELSSVYTVNTQPLLHNFNGQHIMTWAGNTVLGGNSYKRYPLNVAASIDDGLTFAYIQDLFSRTPLQNMARNNYSVTNQHVASAGDTISLIWGEVLMRVDNFTDYLYRTKGAYDSFENTSVKYEGWSGTMGTVEISEAQASEGSRSMVLMDSASVTRSIPYLQDGTISWDLFVETAANMTIELEAAHGEIFGKASPVALEVVNGVIADTGLTLETGRWNSLSFDVSLTEGTVTLTVNGESANISVNTAVGNYICWLDLTTAKTTAYVDNVIVTDLDVISVPDKPKTPETPSAPVEIAGTTMTLGNDLALNFMIEAADITGSGWYAEIVHGDKVTTIDQIDWGASGDYVRIAYKDIAAKEMVDEVTITIYDAKGNKLVSKTDSARAYAMRMFGKIDEAFDTVLADMLNYGAAAQLQFNYRTDDLANSLMTEEQQAMATESIELTDSRKTASGYQGATLGLENNIVLNFFYSAEFIGKTATVSYTDHYGIAHEYEVKVAASGKLGKVSVDKLVISDCSVAVTVTIDGQSVVDSVESYCARMTTLALGEPLMKFAASASAYFNQ